MSESKRRLSSTFKEGQLGSKETFFARFSHSIFQKALGAPDGCQLSIEHNEVTNENEEFYDIAANRPADSQNSSSGAFMLLLKGCFGTGILAMPNAFKNAGLIVAPIGAALLGLLCTYCIHMPVNTSHGMCRKNKVPYLSLSQTVEAVFESGPEKVRKVGKYVSNFIDIILFSTFFFGANLYILFVAESIMHVVESRTGLGWSLDIYTLILLLPLMLVSQMRQLKYLVPLSLAANVLLLLAVLTTFYYMLSGIRDVSLEDRVWVADITKLPVFMSTVIFTIEGVVVVLPVENRMRNPQDFVTWNGVLNKAMILVTVFNILVGTIGYLKYGPDTEASISYNLPDGDILADVAKLMVALSVVSNYELYLYVKMEILWNRVCIQRIPQKWHNVSQIVIRAFLVAWNTGMAIALPNLEALISLTGAITLSTMGLLLPAVLETAFLWHGGKFGRFGWKLWKNALLSCFSLLILVTGSTKAIIGIIDEYSYNKIKK